MALVKSCKAIRLASIQQSFLVRVGYYASRSLSVRLNSDQEHHGLNFELTENQRQLQAMALKFSKEVILPQAAEYDKTMVYPWDIFKKAWNLGLLNYFIPEKYGGSGLGCIEGCIITEALAYGCSGIKTALSSSSLAAVPLILGGSEEQKRKYLGRLIEEPVLAAYAATEPNAGSDVAGLKTTATQIGSTSDEWLINGTKFWITSAGIADWIVVLVRTDTNPKTSTANAFTFFVLDTKTDGIIPGRKEINMGQRCSDTRGIIFENVLAKKENIIGEIGSGFKLAMKVFDLTRPIAAAGAIGVAQRALNEATKYSLERKTFGKKLIEHQAISNILANIAIGIEVARLMMYRAAKDVDLGKRNTFYASIAKVISSEIALQATTDAVQIFGGNGYNTNYPVEKLMRDSKIYQIYEGTTQIQKSIIAKELIAQFKYGN